MSPNTPKVAVFPGSFDPVTNGHLDIIARSLKLFDKVIVAVGENDSKQSMFATLAQIELLKIAVKAKFNNQKAQDAGYNCLDNLSITYYSGALSDFVQKNRANVIIRGIRNANDLQIEQELAYYNRELSAIDTVFLTPPPELLYVSSSSLRELIRLEKWSELGKYTPEAVVNQIKENYDPNKL